MSVSVQGSGLTDRRRPPDANSSTEDPKASSTVMGGRGGLGPGQLALTYPQEESKASKAKRVSGEIILVTPRILALTQCGWAWSLGPKGLNRERERARERERESACGLDPSGRKEEREREREPEWVQKGPRAR